MRQRTNTKRVPALFPILMVLFAAGVIFFGWKIVSYLIDSQKSQDFWGDLQQSAFLEADTGGTELIDWEWEESDGVPGVISFDRLHAVSEDVVAWVYIPGTVINYAVAQGEDNDQYLRHLLNGQYANGGTPFMDYRNNPDVSDWNTVIYGHNMNNGTMFATLSKYGDQSFYEEHPVMYLYIPGKRFKLELVYGYTASANDRVYQLPATKEERDELLDNAAEQTSFDSGVTIGAQDRLVTLSTCSYAFNNARYVVIARIAEVLEAKE